ncbi:MAG: TolC family protein [Rhodocyclaceae bacterium]|nr:TolC family protein [Rhodocyclaceae bacterium]
MLRTEAISSLVLPRAFVRLMLGAGVLCVSALAGAVDGSPPPFSPDPLSVAGGAGSSPAGSLALRHDPCQTAAAPARPLSLAEVVDRALCANPQTREAWANARYQAAQLGLAKSAWLPSLSGTVSGSRNHATGGSLQGGYSQVGVSLAASWLIYDFGAREAAVENAVQLLAAANATQDATVQSVFLAVVQAWSQWFAAQAAVEAAQESEKASQESLKAAERRYEVGTATLADKLQARTAWSQAVLTRIKAEGDGKSARGVLMNALGLAADDAQAIASPPAMQPPAGFEADLHQIIARALEARPDLAAAEAQVKAARASVAQARAAGMPSLSLSAGVGENHTSLADPTRNDSLGLTLTVPLFTGYASTYRIRAAEEQLGAKEAERDRIARQVSLDVWKAYHALTTATQSVRASSDLLESAAQSRRVAKGRFDAGVGGILDLLNAESALASARQQDVQARYNWLVARFTLAQAMGRLSFSDLEVGGK